MAGGIVSTILVTTGLLYLGAPALGTIIGMTIVGALWVFTITPHIVASWLDCSVDSLLGISYPRNPQRSSMDSTDTDMVITTADPTER
jgi:hypothetical protein